MIRKPYLLLIFAGLLLIMTSCYTQKIILNADKNSGQIVVDYMLTEDTFQLLSFAFYDFSADEDLLSPEMLIDQVLFKEKFNVKFKDNQEIKLKSANISVSPVNVKGKTVNNYKGNIVIDFKNLDKLVQQIPKNMSNLKFERTADNLLISQEINFKQMDPEGKLKSFIMDQKTEAPDFYNYLINDAKFTFVIETAAPIKLAEGVKLSNNNKRADYLFKLNDYLKDDGKVLKFLIKL